VLGLLERTAKRPQTTTQRSLRVVHRNIVGHTVTSSDLGASAARGEGAGIAKTRLGAFAAPTVRI
jgi:hypothetical protein